MAVLHRALFTWFLFLLFLILLVLRLDSRTKWNWFIVFIPLWIYDAILCTHVIFHIIVHLKNNIHILVTNSLPRKASYLFAIFLKITFQVLLCLRLEYPEMKLSMFYVMIPVWILLPLALSDVFVSLIKSANS